MNFVSIEFIAFLMLTSIIYYITKQKYRWVILLIASSLFYYLNSGILFLFLIFSIASIYLGGRYLSKIKKNSHKKLLLFFIIFLNVGILFFLKYNSLLPDIFKLSKILIPLGISYYTLMAISYMVDIYQEKIEAEINYFKLMLYMTFFPYILEGPISRFKQMKETLFLGKNFDPILFQRGLLLIMFGFMKKMVIADRAGILVNTVFKSNYAGLDALYAIIFYTIEIYAEFSGCMDIVKGTSLIFGVNVVDNFNTPFYSKSISEFWKRWHITLGTWLKDYIFYPLSVSKLNMSLIIKTNTWKNKTLANVVRVFIPLFFVWFIMGLWHGANPKYILYGLYYFVLIILGMLLTPLNKKVMTFLKLDKKIIDLMGIIRTSILVAIGMTIFRSASFLGAWQMIMSIFSHTSKNLLSLGLSIQDFVILGISLGLLITLSSKKIENKDTIDSIINLKLSKRLLIYYLLLFFILIFGVYGEGYNALNFIYGGF